MKKHGPPPCGTYRLGRRVAVGWIPGCWVTAGGTVLEASWVLTVAGVAPRLAGRKEKSDFGVEE
jgi:hypothetical protein